MRAASDAQAESGLTANEAALSLSQHATDPGDKQALRSLRRQYAGAALNDMADAGVADQAASTRPTDGGVANFPNGFDSPPRIFPGTTDADGLWMPAGNLLDCENAKEMFAHLPRRYEVAKQSTVQDFVSAMAPILKKWDSDKQDPQKMEEQLMKLRIDDFFANSTFEGTRSMVLAQLAESISKATADRLHNADAKEFLQFLKAKGPRYKIANLKDVISDVQKSIDAATALKQSPASRIAESHVRDLQAVLNNFTTNHGLPPTELSLGGTLSSNAGEESWDGSTSISPMYLWGNKNAALVDTLYHELTHHEQHYIVVRNAADKLHIGTAATRSQLDQVVQLITGADSNAENNEAYRDWRTGVERFATEALRQRKDKPLTEEEAAYAETLVKEARAKNTPKQDDYQDYDQRFNSLRDSIRQLQGPDGAERVETAFTLAKLEAQRGVSDTSAQRKMAELYVRAFHRDPELTLEAARQQLIGIFEERQREIIKEAQSSYSSYACNLLEWDGFLTGNLAQQSAKDAGITGF